jgi:hypothetical protein
MTTPISQRTTLVVPLASALMSDDALKAHVAQRELRQRGARVLCRISNPPTYQRRLEDERELHLQQAEDAMPKNRVVIAVHHGIAGAACYDRSERRATYVQLDAPALQQLILDAQNALQQLTTNTAPETLRGAADVLRGRS